MTIAPSRLFFMNQLILETTLSFLNKVVTPILRWAGYEFNYGIEKID